MGLDECMYILEIDDSDLVFYENQHGSEIDIELDEVIFYSYGDIKQKGEFTCIDFDKMVQAIDERNADKYDINEGRPDFHYED